MLLDKTALETAKTLLTLDKDHSQIANHLNKQGYFSPRGFKLNNRHVSAMLCRAGIQKKKYPTRRKSAATKSTPTITTNEYLIGEIIKLKLDKQIKVKLLEVLL
jgi:hypothetical protein